MQGLARRYGSVLAVSDLSASLAPGEVVGLLGPNGAGKSTTLRMLAGTLAPSAGRALVGGVDVSEDPLGARRKVGFLPEVPPIHADMTVQAMLRYAGRLYGLRDVAGATERAIADAQLGDVAHRLIGHLSKGFRQRVGLAVAILHQPEVLLLDEPTSGLDPAQRASLRELLQSLADGSVTILLSTHVLAEVEALCRRVLVMHGGHLRADLRLADLPSNRVRLRVRRSDGLEAALRPIAGVTAVQTQADGSVVVLAERDVRPELAVACVPFDLLELTPVRPLEDTYLALTQGEDRGEPTGSGALL